MTETNNGPRRGVIKTTRAAASAFNGVAALVLRDVTEADGPAYNVKTPQVMALVDDREHMFYANEVDFGDDLADKAKVRPDFLPDRLRQPGTPDQAAWDAAERQSTVQSMEQYLLAYPMGTHAAEARLRRSQIGPGLPPLPTLPEAMQKAMHGQAPYRAKDEDRNVPASGNHPEYGETEDQRKARLAVQSGDTAKSASSPTVPVSNADGDAWNAAVAANTVAGFDNYLLRYPSGAHASEAKSRSALVAPATI